MLYAPVVISVLFSLVEIRRGKIFWETFSFGPYFTLWSNPSVLSAPSNTATVAVLPVAVAPSSPLASDFILNGGATPEGAPLNLSYICLSCCHPSSPASPFSLTRRNSASTAASLQSLWATLFSLSPSLTGSRPRGLQSLPPSLIEASFKFGASRLQTLRYVLLPHLASAVVTGAVLALALSFDETLISTFVAGDQMTLPSSLWAMMRVGFTPEINALVTLVLLVSIALSIITAWRLRPTEGIEED